MLSWVSLQAPAYQMEVAVEERDRDGDGRGGGGGGYSSSLPREKTDSFS
jgi:hypothetical protein